MFSESCARSPVSRSISDAAACSSRVTRPVSRAIPARNSSICASWFFRLDVSPSSRSTTMRSCSMVRSCSRTRACNCSRTLVLFEQLGAGDVDAFFQFLGRRRQSFALRRRRLRCVLRDSAPRSRPATSAVRWSRSLAHGLRVCRASARTPRSARRAVCALRSDELPRRSRRPAPSGARPRSIPPFRWPASAPSKRLQDRPRSSRFPSRESCGGSPEPYAAGASRSIFSSP